MRFSAFYWQGSVDINYTVIARGDQIRASTGVFLAWKHLRDCLRTHTHFKSQQFCLLRISTIHRSSSVDINLRIKKGTDQKDHKLVFCSVETPIPIYCAGASTLEANKMGFPVFCAYARPTKEEWTTITLSIAKRDKGRARTGVS